jgi:hypothetical protein
VRGETASALLFPRDRLRLASDETRAAWPALGKGPAFEIAARPDATTYRIELFRSDGDPFATGEKAEQWTSVEPSLEPGLERVRGRYTWEAWAIIRNLDQRLGSRDFEVVVDPAAEAELAKIASQTEPERTLSAVRYLHERGYLTDARALARQAPASPERDAYLSQVPGR